MYTIWIRIDKTLPWIELKGEYETKKEARQAAKLAGSRIAFKLVDFAKGRRITEPLVVAKARKEIS